MDLDEWEILPDEGYLEIQDDGGKKIFSRKYGGAGRKSVFKMNYFICPSPSSAKFVESTEIPRVPNQLVHVPIQLDHDHRGVKEINRIPIEINCTPLTLPLVVTEKVGDRDIAAVEEADQDTVSQVFFEIKENKFVDMKMDSPRSGTRGAMQPPIEFQFDDETEAMEGMKNSMESDVKEEASWEETSGGGGGLNLWKWSLNGVGAICSFGVAAATICIIILGTGHRNQHIQHNQKLRFQIYADDKRIKQMAHHATRLNEAISAARGVSLTRANITFGGYYDGL